VLKSTAFLFTLSLIAAMAQASAKTYDGPAVTMGNGTAWTFVQADAHDKPVAFGFEFTAGALTTLPARPNPQDRSLDWPYYLYFPAAGPATGFDHVNVDWHPLGHAPQGIYTVPHFDFHVYTIPVSAQLAIHYANAESSNMTGVTMPAKDLMPAGYIVPPGTQVDEMGLHAIPATAPELHGGRFTCTMIYGYDTNASLVFLEPMITISYLLSHPNATNVISQPVAYSSPGYYPASYSVTYHNGIYRVTFAHLRAWHVTQLASRR
jgi:hypothetical protein